MGGLPLWKLVGAYGEDEIDRRGGGERKREMKGRDVEVREKNRKS